MKTYRDRNAWTLTEIFVVVVIIGFLVTAAVPAVRKIVQAAQNSIIVNDMRVFASAFQQYSTEYGEWPEEQAAGVYPPGMEGILKETSWTRQTPIGGNYDWDKDARHGGTLHAAVIAVAASRNSPLTVSKSQLADIDEVLDDGNLSTGIFQLGRRNAPILILE